MSSLGKLEKTTHKQHPLVLWHCFRAAMHSAFIAMILALPAQARQINPTRPADAGQSIDLLRVIVLDVSGSMGQADTKGESRLDIARKEIQEGLTQLPVSNSTPVILVPFSEKVRDGYERIFTNTKELRDAIIQLKADGNTNIAAGLSKAVELANQLWQTRNLVVFIFSDGEHNVGSVERVWEQERNLNRLFGNRTSKGLSQTVVVKRWGGVIGDLVARLQKNPRVNVVDAGELELRTVTLIPSATVKDLKWQDVNSGLVLVETNVAITNYSGVNLPAKTILKISCPLAGCRWLDEPCMVVSSSAQAQPFRLLVKLDPEKFNLKEKYALPLCFYGPNQIKTDRGLLFLVIAPSEGSCVCPTNYLRPLVDVFAKLAECGEPQWVDLTRLIAVWPMKLAIETKTVPPVAWPEQIKWKVSGVDGAKVNTKSPILLHGRSQEFNVSLAKELSLDEVAQGKPLKLQLQLTTTDEPETLVLSSKHILLTTQVKLPALQNTRISQQVSSIGIPQWSDLTTGMVTIPVKLDIAVDGMLTPGAVLNLVPCTDVLKVDGTPVPIHSGPQTVELILTGKVGSARSLVNWSLQLKPPAPSCGIRYTEPSPVTVSFVAPDPVQVVLSNGGKILTRCEYYGSKPEQAVLGHGCVQLLGAPVQQCASANLRIKGLLQNHLFGNGFSATRPGEQVSWSMRPSSPAASVRWWHDVEIKGRLVVLPENAAPATVLGSVIELNLTYEAFYKKVAFYLVVGLGIVLVTTILFWLVKMNLGVCVMRDD
ncbi:MAG: VWA domain-containing protein [Sedimentisphaerales bacterium]|nr:VWA domain-containing protein [Sedimentisphaerales bacterium]